MIVDRIRADLDRQDPFWPAQLTALAAIGLNLVLPERLTAGPTWLLPALELLVFVALFGAQPGPGEPRRDGHRRLALGFISLVGVTTLVSLGLLAHYLVGGTHTAGRSLLGAGVVIWGNFVLIGSLAYWELDRGGPGRRAGNAAHSDFLFTAMSDDARPYVPSGWHPGFADYLYLSLTNATAFSPTDTMPLTTRAKALMGVQSVAALATLGLVVARAVNILG